MSDLKPAFHRVKQSSRKLPLYEDQQLSGLLFKLAERIVDQTPFLIQENQKDLAKMNPENSLYDRLLLTQSRIEGIAEEIRQVAALPSPLHVVLDQKTLPNGLNLKKITVPLGVIGVIYEARPNVTVDVFSLALKSGNGLILKGGSDADQSNQAIMKLIHEVLEEDGFPVDAFLLLPPDRSATQALLTAEDEVDVLIPRGSQGLIDYVRQNARVPVIETGAGIVHTYVDEFADVDKARSIIHNSKTRRPSVCNSLDCLLVHSHLTKNLLSLIQPLLDSGVHLFVDEGCKKVLPAHPQIEKATEAHFGTEFLSLKLAIKLVDSLEEALAHIARYSSKHSEAIISENSSHCERFLREVDAAAVYANASTAFTDGAQFGLGAEIGISTQKLHARGPMALHELTSYKWIIQGTGQIRD